MTLPSSALAAAAARDITPRRGAWRQIDCGWQTNRRNNGLRRNRLRRDRTLHRAVPDQRARRGGGDRDVRGGGAVSGDRAGRGGERSAPHVGLLLRGRRRREELAAQDHVRAAGEHARPRDDLQLRQRFGAAQQLVRPAHRDGRRRHHARRQDHAGDRSRPRLARVLDPAGRPGGAARGHIRHREEPVQQRALRPVVRPHHDHLHVPDARQGAVPVAVLRAVRRGIHRRVRRPHADRRLHGRLHQGRMSASGEAVNVEGTRHWRNVILLWLLASVIMVPVVVFVLGPGLPPGNGSVEASGQTSDNIVLLALATPVALGVLVYLAYALWAFRERTPEVVLDGPPIRGNSSVQFWWLIVTTTLVLFLAGFGTIRLLADGAGGGQGPNPLATPSVPAVGSRLVVQVVAQQWQFNYRFPAYGGVETNQIELPENTLVQFNVTSLDV